MMPDLTPEQRARGGRNKRKASTVRTVPENELPTAARDTMEGLSVWAAWLMGAIATGKIDRSTGNVLLKAIGLQKIVLDRTQIEKRIKDALAQLEQKP